MLELARRVHFSLTAATAPNARLIRPDVRTILDVGSGLGAPMQMIKRKRDLEPTGVDVWRPSIEHGIHHKIHAHYVQGDIRRLPFKDASFDAVMALQVIEHLPKENGLPFIRELERVARKQVILATPVGFMPRPPIDGNDWEEHKSGWDPEELEALGYRTTRWGFKRLYGNEGVVHKVPNTLLSRAVFMTEPLQNVLSRWFPKMADYYFIATRDIKST